MFLLITGMLLQTFVYGKDKDCKCFPWPIPDSCKVFCRNQILASSDTTELTLIFGIKSPLANKIVNNRKTIDSTSKSNPSKYSVALTKGLNENEVKEIDRAFNSLNNNKAKYFALPDFERKEARVKLNSVLSNQ